ncbi:MAG TPA: endonuclease III [Thermoanaerobaculia bacterium]|nr:endonuclease III [Thermoanaerobaculia bacterium]
MLKRERGSKIQDILDRLYPDPAIPLAHDSPFTLLIAVLLSAQTTDARVNMVTPVLFEKASTPESMSVLPVEEIHDAIRSCGLAPGKARNIRKLSQTLVSEYAGKVPADIDKLERLAGVGHKTASVVVSQAFGQPAFPVDTHIHRLAARWRLSRARNVVETERDLKKLFEEKSWNQLHLQMIYFGREYCPARGHDEGGCPICSWIRSPKGKKAEKS